MDSSLKKKIEQFQTEILGRFGMPSHIEEEGTTVYVVVTDFDRYISDEFSELAGEFTFSLQQEGLDFSIIYYSNREGDRALASQAAVEYVPPTYSEESVVQARRFTVTVGAPAFLSPAIQSFRAHGATDEKAGRVMSLCGREVVDVLQDVA